MRRGAVWWARLPPPWGRRPVLLISRDEAYRHLNAIVVAPLTTRARRNASEVPLGPDDGLPERCVATLDSIQRISPDWLDTRITVLRPEKVEDLDRALHFALGITHCPAR